MAAGLRQHCSPLLQFRVALVQGIHPVHDQGERGVSGRRGGVQERRASTDQRREP
jgi:hypothetical protein